MPAGFDKQHSKETAGQDSPQGFRKKQEYLDLYNRVREQTLPAALEYVWQGYKPSKR